MQDSQRQMRIISLSQVDNDAMDKQSGWYGQANPQLKLSQQVQPNDKQSKLLPSFAGQSNPNMQSMAFGKHDASNSITMDISGDDDGRKGEQLKMGIVAEEAPSKFKGEKGAIGSLPSDEGVKEE